MCLYHQTQTVSGHGRLLIFYSLPSSQLCVSTCTHTCYILYSTFLSWILLLYYGLQASKLHGICDLFQDIRYMSRITSQEMHLEVNIFLNQNEFLGSNGHVTNKQILFDILCVYQRR